jgi:hypothetical protein
MVEIAHARMDENGGIDGPVEGDQTGKEIEVRDWYEKGWVYYIECLDEAMGNAAADFAKEIALNSAFGYSQNTRWTGYTSIKNNGFKIQGAHGNLDCSSLVITAYIMAGLNIKASGYTGSIKSIFAATGKFRIYTDKAHTASCAYAKKGSIYLRPKTGNMGGHVFIVISNGTNVISQPVQALEKPYIKIVGKCHVRAGGSTSFASLGIARVGEMYPYKGKAPISEWHTILFKNQIAYVSNKQSLTRLVT